MDFLGKEGEKAAEAVETLSNRIENLESHLNAVDSAVQDTRQESREIDLEAARENRERLIQLEKVIKQITDVQKHTLNDIESERSRESRHESNFNSRIEAIESKLKRTSKNQKELYSKLERVEKKLFSVEEELTNEIGLNQSRIDAAVSENLHEKNLNALRSEISQLKTSVNALADDLDENDITVE